MVSYVPPLMGSGSAVVVTTCSLWKLIATTVACTCEFFWKTLIGTLQPLC
jgi:hypothetical protein